MEAKVAHVNDLQDGAMMKVMVGERAVLLARVGGQLYATGAVCPHYGGSLPDGLLREARVMCPLHQATFDVRTGDMLEPPPLNGIPRFEVRVDGDDVYVDVPDGAPERVAMAMGPFDSQADRRTFAVIGGGAAAAAAVEALRQGNYRGRIVVVSPEDRWPYDRPNLSKGYLSGQAQASWLPLRPARFYLEHGIERVHDRVVALDVKTRAIRLETGAAMTPDAVLIATGGTPRKLSVPGAESPGVFTLRSRDDCDAIIGSLAGATQAVVVGASFIGMEAAANLKARGLAVTVVAPGTVPFERTLGAPVGNIIQALHEANGITFKLGQGVKRISGRMGEARVGGVELDDGTTLPADLVVVGIGVRPATDFVQGAPLNPDGSIDVDEQFRVADGVWAAGDVARFPHPFGSGRIRIEHWRVALQHGRAAARSMLGIGEPFRGVPFFWTLQHGVSFKYVGYAPDWDEVMITGDIGERKFLGYYVKGNQLLAGIGTLSGHLLSFAELMRQGRLPDADALRGKPPAEVTRLFKAMSA
jgi:apoptosis-inducing factor 3